MIKEIHFSQSTTHTEKYDILFLSFNILSKLSYIIFSFGYVKLSRIIRQEAHDFNRGRNAEKFI